MATDTELPEMAVDNEGLGAESALDTSHMQELEMWRILFNQMSNPNPEPETQDLLVKKHNADLECIVAKRQKTQG